MQAQLLIDQVRRELVETVGAFWTDQELLLLLNRAERDYINKTRLLEGRYVTGVTAGDPKIALPSNWLSARALFYNVPGQVLDPTQRWRRLIPTNLEKEAQERPNFLNTDPINQGQPAWYWIWGNELYLDPTPIQSTPNCIVMYYKAKPATLTDPSQQINTDDSLSEAISSYMLWKAWKKEKEPQLAGEAEADYARYIGEGRRWIKRRSGDQQYRIDINSMIPIQAGPSAYNPFLEG